mgnify:CR=1 FL=1
MADQALQYLDPKVLSNLRGLDLIARLVVEGFMTGLHKSPYHGFSVEFAEHRQYMPGDPFKHVDWKLYGKSDRFYVKIFEEETNLRCTLLLDCSGSMGYTSGAVSKLRYGTYLGAALAYLMLLQRDSVGLVLMGPGGPRVLPPRSQPHQGTCSERRCAEHRRKVSSSVPWVTAWSSCDCPTAQTHQTDG